MKKQPTHEDLLRELEALKKQVEALKVQPPTIIREYSLVSYPQPMYWPYLYGSAWPYPPPIFIGTSTEYPNTTGNGTQSVDSNRGMPPYTLT